MSPLRIATNANLFVLYYNNPVASKSKVRGRDQRLPIQRIRIIRLYMLRMLPRPRSTYFCLESLFLI